MPYSPVEYLWTPSLSHARPPLRSCLQTFGDACTINGDDTGCLGWLYCSPGGTCGGKGAQCGDVDGCDTGLECVFASPSSMTGICTNMAQAALPNASQGARKRHLLAKSRFDTWA